jgi:glycosyltransferase involved in cell wall biosynthesis
LHVCVYTPLNRLSIPSGAPRHIIEVVGGLLRDKSLKVSFFANAVEAEKYLPLQGSLWTDAPRITFPRTVAGVSRRWGLLNRPSFESMGGSADWLYLPADAYLPSDNAHMAITIHDVYKLEPPAPGESRREHYQARLRHWVIYRRIAARADQVLTVSQFSADRIMHHLRIPASRIRIVRNGVSPGFFAPQVERWPALRAKLDLQEDEPFFVYAGGLKPKKNGPGIVAAWKIFESRHKEGKLVILGHHEESTLAMARRELQRARFPARLDDSEMAVLLAHSAALFFPSFYEGFGIPVVEAMAAGTLAIVSDIPALRELVGDLGFFVNPHEPQNMAEGLSRAMVIDGAERAERLAAGRQLAAGYTWQEVVRRVRASFT